jgi:hypothetical protein
MSTVTPAVPDEGVTFFPESLRENFRMVSKIVSCFLSDAYSS